MINCSTERIVFENISNAIEFQIPERQYFEILKQFVHRSETLPTLVLIPFNANHKTNYEQINIHPRWYNHFTL